MKHLLFSMLVATLCVMTGCSSPASSDMRVEVIFDNAKPRVMPLNLFGNVPENLVTELGIQQGIPSSVSVVYVEKDGKNLLFDAGNGNDDSQLMPRLKELGVMPEDIDCIFVTHLHGDHIGGLASSAQKAFPNAKLYIAKAEWDAFKAQDNVKALAGAYGKDLICFEGTDMLPAGVKAIAAPGHTPGHTLYLMEDVLIAGDIMHGVALQLKNPEFCARFDMDARQAIEARKRVIEQVKRQGLKMYGMHFPTTNPLELK